MHKPIIESNNSVVCCIVAMIILETQKQCYKFPIHKTDIACLYVLLIFDMANARIAAYDLSFPFLFSNKKRVPGVPGVPGVPVFRYSLLRIDQMNNG